MRDETFIDDLIDESPAGFNPEHGSKHVKGERPRTSKTGYTRPGTVGKSQDLSAAAQMIGSEV